MQLEKAKVWNDALLGLALGMSYGVVTCIEIVRNECFPSPEPFCGFFSGTINLPISLILEEVIRGIHGPPIFVGVILIIYSAIGAFIGSSCFQNKKIKSVLIFLAVSWITTVGITFLAFSG